MSLSGLLEQKLTREIREGDVVVVLLHGVERAQGGRVQKGLVCASKHNLLTFGTQSKVAQVYAERTIKG